MMRSIVVCLVLSLCSCAAPVEGADGAEPAPDLAPASLTPLPSARPACHPPQFELCTTREHFDRSLCRCVRNTPEPLPLIPR